VAVIPSEAGWDEQGLPYQGEPYPEGLDPAALEELELACLGPGAELALMSDADVVATAVQCREAASRAQGRMYRALQELERRRPPPRRYRSGEEARARSDTAGRDTVGRDTAGREEDAPGRRVPVVASAEAVSEIALAFTATEYTAEKLAATSADLWSRLPRLHAELEAGRADHDRVRVIWEGTQDLSDEDAGRVDDMLSAASGSMTTGELREAVRRAAIRIDPAAADKRRKRAEKRARASLYANRSGTATLALEDIPAAQGAAAKERINAIARAAKSSGAPGELAALEARTALGLILGTLPLIPPPPPPGDGPVDGPGDGPVDGSGDDPGEGPGEDPGEGSGGSPEPDGRGPGEFPPGEPFPWPPIPRTAGAAAPGCAVIPAGLTPRRQGRVNLLVPWRTPAGMADEPGELSWFGAVTPGTARDLARAGAADPGARWSVIVTDDAGRAIACAVLRQPRRTAFPGLTGEVTLTIAASAAAMLTRGGPPRERARRSLAGLDQRLTALLDDAVAIAVQATADAGLRALRDEAAGGCAHTEEVTGYRVPETMRRWLTARDRTCRNPVCRQRAARCDWDHTVPFDSGGRTCPCDLGAFCRHHHQLKQLPGWHVRQDGHGAFTWVTPAGLSYRKEPFRYLV
jgi:hypothetical protein